MPGCSEQVGRGVVSGVLWCAEQGGTPGVGRWGGERGSLCFRLGSLQLWLM